MDFEKLLLKNLKDEFIPHEYNKRAYSPINEQNLFSSFGLPFREDHKGGGDWYRTSRPTALNGKCNQTAISQAIIYGAHIDVRNYLQSDPKLVNQSINMKSDTSLHVAILSKVPKMVEIVLQHNPDFSRKNS